MRKVMQLVENFITSMHVQLSWSCACFIARFNFSLIIVFHLVLYHFEHVDDCVVRCTH